MIKAVLTLSRCKAVRARPKKRKDEKVAGKLLGTMILMAWAGAKGRETLITLKSLGEFAGSVNVC